MAAEGGAKTGGAVYWMAVDLPILPDASRTAYLLPGFDEYVLGYKDRSGMLNSPLVMACFCLPLVIDGRVVGTWKCGYHLL